MAIFTKMVLELIKAWVAVGKVGGGGRGGGGGWIEARRRSALC